jgi:beta-galactosidase
MASLLLLAPLLSPLIVEGAFVAAPDERTVWERATGAPAAASATAATGPSDSSSRRAVPAHVQHLPPADPSSSSSTSSSISGFLYYDKAVHGEATSVSHDGRSVRINNQSTILLSGSVHYMRLTPGMWAEIFAEARAGGLNAIETYCFWTDHEQVRNGGFDFSGRKNLSGFVRAAGEAGLWVLLRPGPYVGAEYSGGGFPHWLRDIPGLKYRNYNQPWIDESTRWMSQLNVTLRDDLVGNGGNIIMAQIENEWNPGSNCMQHTGPDSWTDQDENGVQFYLWNWQLVQSLQWNIPWMWNSGVPPASLLKGRTTGLIAGQDGDHVRGAPGGLWIEDEGWYTNWGDTPKHQTASNMANRVLAFIAGGGCVHSYYMFFGASWLHSTS